MTLPRSILYAENKAASGATPIKLANYSGKVLLVNSWATGVMMPDGNPRAE